MGGRGGGASIPFFSDAPGGRSTVSMTEVAEINTGSEISDFTIDFLRVPAFVSACVFALNVDTTGVEAAEMGGVALAEKGGIGEGRLRKALKLGLGAPGDGRGDTGSPGENDGLEPLAAGDRRAPGAFRAL